MRRYNEEDMMYLENAWGKRSMKIMTRDLNRTEEAIRLKACRIGLGSVLENKDFFIITEVEGLLGITRKTLNVYTRKYKMPFVLRVLGKKKYKTIMYHRLIEWLEANEIIWSSTRADIHALKCLGYDEKKLDAKHKNDMEKLARKTLSEDDVRKIIKLYKEYISYEEIARILNKEMSCIKWKIHNLLSMGVLERNSATNRIARGINRKNYGWTKEQDTILIEEFRKGTSLREISRIVGKTLSATKSRNQRLTKLIMNGVAI